MTQRMRLVPEVATEEMWNGLARDIVMWRDMDKPTGSALYQHLGRLGREVPDWLKLEIPDINHVPPKGSVAVAIHRAMIAASPNGGCVTDADRERAAEALYTRDPLVNIVKSRDAPIPWQSISEGARNEFRDDARAALAALGLPLASEPPPAATEEGR